MRVGRKLQKPQLTSEGKLAGPDPPHPPIDARSWSCFNISFSHSRPIQYSYVILFLLTFPSIIYGFAWKSSVPSHGDVSALKRANTITLKPSQLGRQSAGKEVWKRRAGPRTGLASFQHAVWRRLRSHINDTLLSLPRSRFPCPFSSTKPTDSALHFPLP